ncbi:MAG: hypothetical protein ABSF67_07545 [Roseiarcus sp.]
MTSHRSLRSTVGGLLAVAFLAAAPFAPAWADTVSNGNNSPEPNIYAPPTATTFWGVPRTSADDGSTISYGGGRLANLCPAVVADPGAYRPQIVAECEGGSTLR